MSNACDGEEWYPNARGFTRLKLLLIEDNDVKYWKATDDNFPVLERLVLKKMQISERDTCTNPHTTTDSVKMVSSQTWGICSAYLKRTRRPRKRPYGCSYLQSLSQNTSGRRLILFLEQLLEKRRQGEDEQQEHSIGFYSLWGV
ncbi:hypothetical protein CQW23_06757 [Capsicum baccatum]|uniref:Uncharacterized protein n=1 Tax=Capsicum baccatum TaxID=33114 RepID=A0A2G2X476_CAPBA|nr:hypothetical protein CQW23_06757 [Capsicum baccatum]